MQKNTGHKYRSRLWQSRALMRGYRPVRKMQKLAVVFGLRVILVWRLTGWHAVISWPEGLERMGTVATPKQALQGAVEWIKLCRYSTTGG